MTPLEQRLIDKTSYIQLFPNQLNHKDFFVQALAELYYEEQKKDIPNLNDIRFSQGEIYYLIKDYESAIFKWENIRGDREPWARKNMADAYIELAQYTLAENIYKEIHTDSSVLQAEIALQLFSLYIQTDRKLEASAMIKELVATQPDYPDATRLARLFFEEQGDYLSAIELVVGETVRTQTEDWFEIITRYAEEGKVSMMEPAFYQSMIKLAFEMDPTLFERVTVALWHDYEKNGQLFAFMMELNSTIHNLGRPKNHSFSSLTNLYKTAFADILAGAYSIKEAKQIVPRLLSNWLMLTNTFSPVACSIVAWEEVFPDSFEESTWSIAKEKLLTIDPQLIQSTELHRLFHAIVVWGAEQGIEVSNKLRWMMSCLSEVNRKQILFFSTNTFDHEPLLNDLLQHPIPAACTSKMTWFSYGEEEQIEEISSIATVTLNKDKDYSIGDTYLHVKQPFPGLRNQQSRLIYMPPFQGTVKERSALLVNVHLAEAMIFVLHHQHPLNEQEWQLITQLQKKMDTPIQFLVKQEFEWSVQEKLASIMPDAILIPYDETYHLNWEGILNQHVTSKQDRRNKELFFIQETLQYLTAKRVDQEEKLTHTIQLNKDMLAKVSGASAQLADVEGETSNKLKRAIQKILSDTKMDLEHELPNLLKSTATSINEEVDFSTLHIHLNETMNNRIETYIEQTVLPKLYVSLQKWVKQSQEELEHIHGHLHEMAASFNALYAEDKFDFQCDSQIIHDWRRDVGRLTSGIQLEHFDLFNKFNPVQFLLKSAGKLLGGIGQNKTILQAKYKQHVETMDFKEVVESTIKQVLTPFQLFTLAIDRDMEGYLRGPREELTGAADEIVTKMEELEQTLQKIYTEPEMFEEPLKLFEVHYRLLQVAITKKTKEKQLA